LEKRHRLCYLVFGMLLVILLVYVFFPVLGVIIPSLQNVHINLDANSDALAAILVFLAFALIFIDKLPPSSYLQKFKLSTQGVEGEFQRVEQMANKIRDTTIDPQVQTEVDEIRRSNSDPKAVFFELIVEIEKKMRYLDSKTGMDTWKYTPTRRLVDGLTEKGVIDLQLANLIKEFLHLRNKTIHGEVAITNELLDESIQIGETIISKFEKALKKLPQDEAT
jgi:hypothetical protein